LTHSHLHCRQHGAFSTTKIAQQQQQQQQQQYEKGTELTPNLLHQCHTLKDNKQQLGCSPTIEQLKQPLLLPIKDCSAAAAAITTTPNKQMGLLPNNNLQKPTPPSNNSKALLHKEVLTSNCHLLVLLDSDSEKDEKSY